MSEKTYPPTAYKLKQLRDKGIVPYSHTAHKAYTIVILIICIYLFFPQHSPLVQTIHTTSSQGANAQNDLWLTVAPYASYAIKVLCTSSVLSLIVHLYLTKFLLLPLGRYKNGIKKEKEDSRMYIEKYAISCSIVFLSIFFLVIMEHSAYVSISDTISSLLAPYLYGLCTILTCVGVFSTYLAHVRFYEDHRMSKGEILAELIELEGSGESKRAIKEQF